MHHPEHQADLQFRILCNTWNALSQDQKDKIEKLTEIHRDSKKNLILIGIGLAYAGIWFLINHEAIGLFAAITISPLILFYAVHFWGFLFNAFHISL